MEPDDLVSCDADQFLVRIFLRSGWGLALCTGFIVCLSS